jgi:hypothetical protein
MGTWLDFIVYGNIEMILNVSGNYYNDKKALWSWKWLYFCITSITKILSSEFI